MAKHSNQKPQTPLEYYEKAILQLTETQEELQEELKSIREMRLSHENLKTQLQEAKEEIKTLTEKLRTQEIQERLLESDETKIIRIEKNTNYLHQEIESLKNEIHRIKNSEQNNNYFDSELKKLKETLEIKQKQLNEAQKDIGLASDQTAKLSAKLNEISQNANISRTLLIVN